MGVEVFLLPGMLVSRVLDVVVIYKCLQTAYFHRNFVLEVVGLV